MWVGVPFWYFSVCFLDPRILFSPLTCSGYGCRTVQSTSSRSLCGLNSSRMHSIGGCCRFKLGGETMDISCLYPPCFGAEPLVVFLHVWLLLGSLIGGHNSNIHLALYSFLCLVCLCSWSSFSVSYYCVFFNLSCISETNFLSCL